MIYENNLIQGLVRTASFKTDIYESEIRILDELEVLL